MNPRNDVGCVDALAYLPAALEDVTPRQIVIDNQEEPSISWIKSDISNIFLVLIVFFVQQYKQNFTESGHRQKERN